MTGESLTAASERADVLAYLERKRASAARVAEANAPERARATAIRQFIEVLISDIFAGLHEGEAALAEERRAAAIAPRAAEGRNPFAGHRPVSAAGGEGGPCA